MAAAAVAGFKERMVGGAVREVDVAIKWRLEISLWGWRDHLSLMAVPLP